MTLRHEGEYDTEEVIGGFRAVELTVRGRDVHAPTATRRDRPMPLEGLEEIEITFDSADGHVVLRPHGDEVGFHAVQDAVLRLERDGELTVVHADCVDGEIVIVPNLEAPAELCGDEPAYSTSVCAQVHELILDEMTLAGAEA